VSRKTLTASSKVTPCFAALASAFRGSHSNTYSVYTECTRMLVVTDRGRPSPMSHAGPKMRKKTPKRVLALPDLEHAKSAVLSSLTSRSGQRPYDHAIREFVGW
jgi:hypothetical protein